MSGGLRSTTATTVEPERAAATTRGSAHLGPLGRGHLGAVAQQLLGLDVDEEDACHGSDRRDHGRVLPSNRLLLSSAVTSALARRAAEIGLWPPAPCAQIGDRERVARSGGVAANRPRRHAHGGIAREDERPAGAERHDDLRHAEPSQLLELAVAEDRLRLLLGELEDRDVAQERPVEVPVEPERADLAGCGRARGRRAARAAGARSARASRAGSRRAGAARRAPTRPGAARVPARRPRSTAPRSSRRASRGAPRRRSGTRTTWSRLQPRATPGGPALRGVAGTSAARARRTSRPPSPPAARRAMPAPRTRARRRSARRGRPRGHATEGRSRRAVARPASVRPSDRMKARAKLGSEPPIAPWPGWV